MSGPQKGPPRLPPSVTAAQQQLIRLYKEAAARIQKQLASATLTSFQQFRLGEQLQQIKAIITALDAGAYDLAPRMIGPSYRMGSKLSEEALRKAGMDLGAINAGNILNTEAVALVADQMAAELMAANASIETQARRFLRATQQKLISERDINDAIARGAIEGETRKQVSDRLLEQLKAQMKGGSKFAIKCRDGKTRLYDPEYYAELVARTRTREAVTAGAIRTGMDYDVYLYQVSVHSGACEMCVPYQGKIYAVVEGTGFPLLEERPPYHPHCVLPETPVFAPGKRAAFVATYNGPVVDLALSNSARLTVTPNHMLLTPSGFAFAKDLSEGDEVLCSAAFEDVVFRNPDNNNRPSSIEQVVRALSESGGMATTGVPVSSEDLHGDARFVDGNIDVVRANGLLTGDIESSGSEAFRQDDFDGPDIGLLGLLCARDTATMLNALALAADSIMPHLRKPQQSGVAPISLCDAALAENSINYDLDSSEFAHQFSGAFPGDISPTDLVMGEPGTDALLHSDATLLESVQKGVLSYSESLQNIAASHPGSISTARIINKRSRIYFGHVYDLQTSSSLYICNGVLSSNCAHVLTARIFRNADEEARMKGFSNTKAGVTSYDEYQAAIA
jgi:hypothetical protein